VHIDGGGDHDTIPKVLPQPFPWSSGIHVAQYPKMICIWYDEQNLSGYKGIIFHEAMTKRDIRANPARMDKIHATKKREGGKIKTTEDDSDDTQSTDADI